MKNSNIVKEYNDSINRRDIGKLERLIHDNYAFIDTAGTRVDGKILEWQVYGDTSDNRKALGIG